MLANFVSITQPLIMRIFLSLFLLFAFTTTNAQLNGFQQEVAPPPIPKRLSFAGERVPLEEDDIRERLEEEIISNTFFHSRTLKILKEVARYRPEIDPILEAEGVPKDFFYLAVAESGLDNMATSPAGAKGMWQIMEATGKHYDLEINNYVDERRNHILAAKAACQFLKKLKDELGSWTNAAAAYNRGESGIKRAIEGQKVDSYYDLYLNQETYRYVFRILAFKLIIENPIAYGFNLTATDLYKPFKYKEIIVDSTISSLPDFAFSHKTNYKELKRLNPWLDHNAKYMLYVGNGKKYKIRVPLK